MLRNNEKIVVISTTSNNEWTQQKNHINDHNMSCIATNTPPQSKLMDHNKLTTFSQEQQNKINNNNNNNNNNQEAMRCPRCDSSNTKFCYYNNYSLSQPRHFCKACKRYWTRGGTLRNVPVGGGCRKNKRVVRRSHNPLPTNHPSSDNPRDTSVYPLPLSGGAGAGDGDGNANGNGNGNYRDLISSNSNATLFYSLPTNHHQNLMNFPFSHQINSLGLGFSNLDGMNHYNKQIFQDFISSNPSLSNYSNTTTTDTTTTTTPTISSLLASNFDMKGDGGGGFETLLPSYGEEGGMFSKDVKMEIEGQNRSLNYQWSAPSQNHIEHSNNIGSPPCDPSIIWGNGPNLSPWIDSTTNNNNLTSSIPSLI